MTNKQKIDGKCKELGLEIEDLSFERTYDYVYVDGGITGYWKLQLKNGKYYETSIGTGFGVDVEVEILCDDLEVDYKLNKG